MKAKSKAKAKTRSRSKTRAKPKKSRTTRTTATPRPASITTPPLSPDFKTCEEVEVGDIGGVGESSRVCTIRGSPRAPARRHHLKRRMVRHFKNPNHPHTTRRPQPPLPNTRHRTPRG